MTKSDLIAAVTDAALLSRADANRAVNATLELIGQALEDGDKVTLIGFGTFKSELRAARTGRNPNTGKPLEIPETNVVRFSPSKRLSERLK